MRTRKSIRDFLEHLSKKQVEAFVTYLSSPMRLSVKRLAMRRIFEWSDGALNDETDQFDEEGMVRWSSRRRDLPILQWKAIRWNSL